MSTKKAPLLGALLLAVGAVGANATTITVYGRGGATTHPDGTAQICPIAASGICGTIKTGVTGDPIYPDWTTTFTDTGVELWSSISRVIQLGPEGPVGPEGPTHWGAEVRLPN